MKILDVLIMDNWRPTVCSYCKKLCMATDGSLVLWFVSFTVVTVVAIYFAYQIIEINEIFAVVVALVVWPLTFPSIVKAKKYKIRKYWLPKNRLLGYFVYLVVPVGVIILALAAAVHFEVGM